MTTPEPGPASPYAPGAGSPYGPGAGSPYGQGAGAPYAPTPTGAPGFGYPTPSGQVPPPGWATPSGYVPPWAPPPVRPTETLAVASLVVSCAGVVTAGLTGPVGLGLGIAALRRVRRTGAQGRGLALAGIWVGAAMSVVLLLVVLSIVLPVLLFASTVGSTGASGTTSSSGPSVREDDDPLGPGADAWGDEMAMPWFELTDAFAPGDCFATAPETYDMSDATVVDCAVSHASEVVDRLTMSTPVLEDLSMPDAEYTDLLDRCEDAVGRALDPAVLPEESYADVYYPHPSQWGTGGRSAYCVLTTYPSGTGSALAGTYSTGTGASV